MADVTITRGKTFPDSGNKKDLHELIDLATGSVTNIVNADIKSSAAIAGTKIAPNFGSQDVVCAKVTATDDIVTSGSIDIGGVLKFDGNFGSDKQVLQSNGSATPTWVTKGIASIYDYGTSTSSYTSKEETDLKICYGQATVAGGNPTTQTITNLPFTSYSSYKAVCSGGDGTDNYERGKQLVQNSGSQLTLYNYDGSTNVIKWIAIGV